jgi:hypothetical protein
MLDVDAHERAGAFSNLRDCPKSTFSVSVAKTRLAYLLSTFMSDDVWTRRGSALIVNPYGHVASAQNLLILRRGIYRRKRRIAAAASLEGAPIRATMLDCGPVSTEQQGTEFDG